LINTPLVGSAASAPGSDEDGMSIYMGVDGGATRSTLLAINEQDEVMAR
jgi:hypothetical protein